MLMGGKPEPLILSQKTASFIECLVEYGPGHSRDVDFYSLAQKGQQESMSVCPRAAGTVYHCNY